MKSAFIIFSSALLLTNCETSPKKRDRVPPPPVPLSASEPVHSAQPPATTVDASGVATTPSGLRYRVLSSGPADGRSPSHFDSVIVHYRGTLKDGTVFDSSIDRGQPATFGVSQVIPGWTEALKLMKPGDQWVLYIPARLAYGNQAVGAKIPANSDLVFQVALIQVVSGL